MCSAPLFRVNGAEEAEKNVSALLTEEKHVKMDLNAGNGAVDYRKSVYALRVTW